MSRLLFFLTGLFFFSTSFAQKYEGSLDQVLTYDDLAYMPSTELQQLKNEIILLKSADIKPSKAVNDDIQQLAPNQLLDQVSEQNLSLIDQLQVNVSEASCSREELFQSLLFAIEGKTVIPLYLQAIFLEELSLKNAQVYLLPNEQHAFVGVIISRQVNTQEEHQLHTFTNEGIALDKLAISGKHHLKDNQLFRLEDQQKVATIDKNGKIKRAID